MVRSRASLGFVALAILFPYPVRAVTIEQVTFDDANHYEPAINDDGEIVWR